MIIYYSFISNDNIKIANFTFDLTDYDKALTINKQIISIKKENEYYLGLTGISCVLMPPNESLGSTNDLLTCFSFKSQASEFYSFTLEIAEELKEIKSLEASKTHTIELTSGYISALSNERKEKIFIYTVLNGKPFWATFDYINKFSNFTLENVKENSDLRSEYQFHKFFYFTQTKEFILISEYVEGGCNKLPPTGWLKTAETYSFT